jgi:hypothetical protein
MRPDSHELYGRRRSRNVGVGLVLGGFAVLVFAVTLVKLTAEGPVEGFDHAVRASALPAEDAE